jgi:phage tail sheath protein FI
MPFQVSPGVNISEIDLTTVVPNVATSIGAMAGAFQWGPVLKRVRVSTENELVEVFGEPTAQTAEFFWTAANYLAYANNLLVVRAIGDAALNSVVKSYTAQAAATNLNRIDNDDDFDGTTFAGTGLFYAKYPGLRGNSLKAIAIDSAGWDLAITARTANITARNAGTATQLQLDQLLFVENFDRKPLTSTNVAASSGSNDEMHILVIDENGLFSGTAGEILETFAFVSKANDAKKIEGGSNYVRDVLKNESRYIWLGTSSNLTAGNVTANQADAGDSKASNTFKDFIVATDNTTGIVGGVLAGAADGFADADTPLITANLTDGYNLFSDAETVDITLLIAGPRLGTSSKFILDLATTRKDCVAFISPLKATVLNIVTSVQASDAATDIVTEKEALGSSSYGVFDNAWKYQYDRYRDTFVNVPMNGDIAGLCARTDFTHDAWYSPAGLNRGILKNIVRPTWDASKANRDELYKGGVNPITTQLGAGAILFGDKTMLAVPSAFDRINVRRLFIVLEKAIAVAAKAMLFEFNDEFTRSQFVNIVTPFLREVQGRRGITDFKVVCDSSNNTGQVIDTNNFVGDIYIKPNRSINFIQLNFIAARSDVSFSEIGG